jgi:hypothetical protein
MIHDVVNLDGSWPDDLREFARTCRHSKLRRYARRKAAAMEFRANGWITAATMAEQTCERIYSSLPQSLRW